jgi:peptidoglycan/LPS O-acetylase OafA/YrhL
LPAFLSARLLRLWPALLFCAVLVSVVIGPGLTSLSPEDYFHARGTWEFVPRLASLVGASATLPGVATTLATDPAIDAPLWTLKYEALCYVALACFGLWGGFSTPRRFWLCVIPVILILATVSLTPIAHDATHPFDHVVRFGLCFGLGTIAYYAAARIPLTFWGIVGAFGFVVLARNTAIYEFGLCLLTAYTTIWVALVPSAFVRNFNRLGDYSYGLYIYAYPLQQLFAQRMPYLTPLALFAMVMPLALALAVISWHWLERPSLAQKRDLAA